MTYKRKKRFNLTPYLAGSLSLILCATFAPSPNKEEGNKLESKVKSISVEQKKPYATEINGKSVLIYEFSQKDIAIDFITPKKPKSFGYFVENAKYKYGNKLS